MIDEFTSFEPADLRHAELVVHGRGWHFDVVSSFDAKHILRRKYCLIPWTMFKRFRLPLQRVGPGASYQLRL